MTNLKAPLALMAIGTTYFATIGEPLGIVLTAIISGLGYTINKAAN